MAGTSLGPLGGERPAGPGGMDLALLDERAGGAALALPRTRGSRGGRLQRPGALERQT